MKKIFSLLLLPAIVFAQSYTITVNGDPSDWDSNDGGYDGSQLSVHGTGYFNGQWIYKGESGDQRTDISNNADNDITEIRFGNDGTYLYFLIRMQNIENGGDYVYISLSIDVDQNGSDDALTWNGDDSQTSVGSASQYGERNLIVHDVTSGFGTNLQFELFADNGSSWYAPPTAGYQISVSTTNECAEGRIDLTDLASLTSTSSMRVSLATFVNGNNGYNNDVDATQDIGGGTISDAIDVMTPGASSSTNAWNRDISDGDIDNSSTIDLSQAPLPVELTSFTASVKGNIVTLNWQTSTEVNNSGFEILRSAQDDNWEKIGFVEGYGNSNSPKEYSFTDDLSLTRTLTHTLAYRLRQIDNNGSFDYSNVVEVFIGELPNGFVLEQNYPNPFNPSTKIKFGVDKQSEGTLKVFNTNGEEVAELFSGRLDAGRIYEVEFSVSDGNSDGRSFRLYRNLTSGVYLYKLQTPERTEVKKMLLLK